MRYEDENDNFSVNSSHKFFCGDSLSSTHGVYISRCGGVGDDLLLSDRNENRKITLLDMMRYGKDVVLQSKEIKHDVFNLSSLLGKEGLSWQTVLNDTTANLPQHMKMYLKESHGRTVFGLLLIVTEE